MNNQSSLRKINYEELLGLKLNNLRVIVGGAKVMKNKVGDKISTSYISFGYDVVNGKPL